jgi:uroporphyrinogen-III decarboxylase
MAAYRGETADRIPMASPISWQPMRDIAREKPGGWRNDPAFIRLAALVEKHCDPVPPYNPMKLPPVFSTISYQRFMEAPDDFIERLPAKLTSPTRTEKTTVLHTPKGDLFWTTFEDDGIETSWDMRKPIERLEDIEKMLSVPYSFKRPDAAAFEPFREYRQEMGRDCIGGAGINSMVAMLCGMMDFELLLEWVMTEPATIKRLADVWLERTWEKVDFLLSQGVGPFWHFNGVERASPPMMGPRQWNELVVPYDGEIMRRIKARDPEAKIHVHCHGKVATLLPSWLDMGVDSTDPVEPPAQGNIAFADAKRLVAGRMTLFGNIEFVDMERCTPDEMEARVRTAIEDGGKKHMLLYPSATPHERHSDRLLANAERYIQAGVKYGTF